MVSTKGHYALRVMIDLVEYGGEGYILSKGVAERQEISERYLEIIVREPIKERMLIGLGGRGGRYRPCRKPEEYPVGEILGLTEGSLATVACLPKDANPYGGAAICKTPPMWAEFDKMAHDYFYGEALEDLLQIYVYKSWAG